ncbi:xanthine dehydrogenase accessory protein XdhC [Frigidibacter sp. ROC022]|uniref:xanthine dehydrogenase accessory protein XdhC n=1 Tax=Frigidibacter sp. ROC022 TaxID=2971796 RepID=UPI00215B5334|nr:xanthine dehydrogenase accessory protein XdhC [Frigidibacter sp. ROC022]MCR8722898.1 xanthine dehydrogenase accessory protein XdhC [Frigidibacter sp. ROC022]
MSLDRAALSDAVARHGPVARIVVAEVQGSAPREVGAAMLVWVGAENGGQSGTIGGGALELQATGRARQALAQGQDRLDRVPLGPGLGQCCGGAVTLLTELWDRDRLAGLTGEGHARPLPGTAAGEAEPPPLAVRRWQAALRNGTGVAPGVLNGWMVEPFSPPGQDLWVWGAGHVGRAVVGLMAALPGWRITWADTAAGRFPDSLPDGVDPLVAADLAAALPYAPPRAQHLILTYSHEIDLQLCHAALQHGFGWCGLIGSASKWARFRSRLRQLGHSDAAISGICCPIGRKSFGKHPQAIAVGLAADLLSLRETATDAKDATG